VFLGNNTVCGANRISTSSSIESVCGGRDERDGEGERDMCVRGLIVSILNQ
jgi:hypothetical protein